MNTISADGIHHDFGDGHVFGDVSIYYDYGNVIFEGVEYQLTEQAYVVNAGTEGEVVYHAGALDPDGNAVRVIWSTTNKWRASIAIAAAARACQKIDMKAISKMYGVIKSYQGWDVNDESNACDWHNPGDVFRVK